jgi:hypothetical protein
MTVYAVCTRINHVRFVMILIANREEAVSFTAWIQKGQDDGMFWMEEMVVK